MSRDDLQTSAAESGPKIRPWALVLGTTVALATATFVVALGIRRARAGQHLADVPDIIADCFERINKIESDLRRVRPRPESAH